MNVIIFEDFNTDNLKPFSINHVSFELKCGIYSNLERIINSFDGNVNYYFIVRDELKELVQEKFPRYMINPKNIPEGLYLNGAAVWNHKYIDKVSKGYAFSSLGNLIAFKSNDSIDFKNINSLIEKTSSVTSDIDINYISYLWDCIDLFDKYLLIDCEDFLKCGNTPEAFLNYKEHNLDSSIIIMENSCSIYVSKKSTIESGCILDSRNGSIIINDNVKVESGSIIKGPIFIDKESIVINGAKLKGNILIGPKCKIGGEVINTIFHGYSNKQHDGFLGNSYVGEWVNFGANTNNSNLKNNYSRIKFNFSDKIVDTNRMFLGAMVGDFTRTGISTMINTGSYIGLGSNVFGGSFQKKHISSFSWGRDVIVEFNKFIDTVKIMKERRSEKLTDTEIAFLKNIYKKVKK